MSEMLETIVQTIESYQSFDSWSPEKLPAESRSFAHFVNEWCSHLDPSTPVKSQILQQWSQGDELWRSKALNNSSPHLFAMGSSLAWTQFWEALQNLGPMDSPLPICDDVIEWGRQHINASVIQGLDQEPLAHPAVRRRVLGILPYRYGVLSLVLVKFSPYCLTPPHRHPECLAEAILSGEVAELQFSYADDETYSYEKLHRLKKGDKTLSHCDDGSPHMIFANAKDTVTLAVFAGSQPIQYFEPKRISNPDDLNAAITSLKAPH